VIASNRVALPSEQRPQAGGLAVALKGVLGRDDIWFGWSGKVAPETSRSARITPSGGVTYATIDLSEEDYRPFYVGFANSSLWPLLHFRMGLIEFRREHFEGYIAANRAFANALAPLLAPDDLVWVHDYHLIPMAEQLRAHGLANRIGFFLHVPFVPPSVLAALPRAEEILRMLCAYDVVGFQTEEHRRDFLDCLRHLVGADVKPDGSVACPGRRMVSIVAPAGIDAAEFAAQARRAVQGPESERLRASLAGRAFVIGVDRLDYSKGLANRFEAFARLLTRFPEHRQKVSYLQIAPRSREDVDEYQRVRRDLDRIAGNVNGRFAEFDWVPVRYMTRSLARRTLAGFYRVARIGLVTPLRDGMNLVAKEFVAAQDLEDPGVLVLSRFAGAALDLTDALIVNPHDPDEIAEAVHQGLTMPLAERRERHARLFERVNARTADAYGRTFLAALRGPPTGRNRTPAPATPEHRADGGRQKIPSLE
jgi:trehalose 6-phosphate synthase